MNLRQTFRVDLPSSLVWDYLSNLKRRPEWDFRLRGVEIEAPLAVSREGIFHKLQGSDRRISVHQLAAGERLRLWEEQTGGALEWEIRLVPEGEGTQVTMEVAAIGASRLLKSATLDQQLKETAANLERRLKDPSDQEPRYPFTLEGFPMVHRAMRNDLSRLDTLLRRILVGEGVDVDVVRAWFAFSWSIAQGHHVGEDAEVFPRVAARSPEFRKAWSAIESEHGVIDEMVKELDLRMQKGVEGNDVEGALEHLHRLRGYLEGHLVREEVAFERAIRADWSPEEQLNLQNVLRFAIPVKLIELVVPWMLEAATEQERKKVLSQLPLPARMLYRLSWHDHYQTLLQPFAQLPA